MFIINIHAITLVHSKWNRGRQGRKNIDDDSSDELIQILELISNVLNRDVIDLSVDSNNPDVKLVAASDVRSN